MPLQHEVDIIVKGIALSWTAWGKMRGEKLVLGDVSYVKSENGKGFERIFAVDIDDDQEFRVGQMIAAIKAGTLPDSMLITPNTRPADLAEILSRRGFVIDDAAPCMIMRLDTEEKKESGHPNLDISMVKERDQLADWLMIVNAALFDGELVTLAQMSDVLALDNTSFYLGTQNSKPVAACMTIMEGQTSVLEMVATLKEHRGRGFASAVIHRALVDLRHKGVKTVSLRAEADGVNVYKRLGFKECFKRVVATYDKRKASDI